MKFYKLVQDNQIIGVVNSGNFFKFSPITNCFLRSNESEGEYISYNGNLYRSTWMLPSAEPKEHIEVLVLEISQEEYEIYASAIENNEAIIEEQTNNEEAEEEIYIDPIDQYSINFIRTSKIKEMSRICNQTIENGFDIEIQGETHHFSLTVQDQLNLITLSSMATQGVQQIPYHADGELCKFYTAAEINTIVNQATIFKTYHTTYYNALKAYINSLETIEEIGAITYGIELPEEFQTDVLRAITQ